MSNAVPAAAPGLPKFIPSATPVLTLYARWLTLRGCEADEGSLSPDDPDAEMAARTASVEEAARQIALTGSSRLLDVHHKIEVLSWLLEREDEMGPTDDQRHLAMLRSISRDVVALAYSQP